LTPEATLAKARLIAGALAAGVLALALVAGLVDVDAGVRALTAPAALLGIVSPVIGYRVYHYQRERAPADEGVAPACARFLRATVAALAVTEAAALFGVVAFMIGGGPYALVGVAMHLLLAGALWPSEEKLDRFVAARR
jgi:hypothetical protein